MAIKEKKFYIETDGLKIYTYSKGESHNTIVFIHGNSLSSEMWDKQISDPHLYNNYRLIVFDLPGHGKSEWIKNGSAGYKMHQMAKLINALLNFYKIESYILVGLSLGTNLIGEIVTPLTGCKGIVLASPCIVSKKVTPPVIFTGIPVPPVNIMATPSQDELRQFAACMAYRDETLVNNFIRSYNKTDPAFREELFKTIVANDYSNELENIVNWQVPVCVIFGNEERLIHTDYLDDFPMLWNKRVLLIENAGHLVNEECSEVFNDILVSFAEAVFR